MQTVVIIHMFIMLIINKETFVLNQVFVLDQNIHSDNIQCQNICVFQIVQDTSIMNTKVKKYVH